MGPDPARIEKLLKMPKPQKTKDVEWLLGLVNQLSKFSLDYIMQCPRLKSLTHKGVKFYWDADIEREYCELMANFANLEYLEPCVLSQMHHILGWHLFCFSVKQLNRAGALSWWEAQL